MNRAEFYKYAVACNKDINCEFEEVESKRDSKIKNASPKTIEIASFIKDNCPFKMQFEICLSKKFKKYDYNWADIRLPQSNIFIFVVNNEETRDAIFQIYKRKYILIFDENVTMDEVGEEIIKKLQSVDIQEKNKKRKFENRNNEKEILNRKNK